MPSEQPEPGAARVIARALAAAPDGALAAAYLVTWIAPFRLGDKAVSSLVLVLLMEFIIIHSSAFMGTVMFSPQPKAARARKVLGLGILYTLFVSGFALAFQVWWPIVAFWLLTFRHFLGTIAGNAPSGEERRFIQSGWAASALCYLMAIPFTLFLPIPRLGIDDAVVDAQAFSVGGAWTEEPHRAVAAGFLYFAALTVSEFYAHAWTRKGIQQ